MQLESLFTDQKWNILKALSSGPSSPLQLSEALSTTMANISQQLRLLEATNLVKKEKIRNRDKGKPRILYSLNGEYALLVPTSSHFAEKKLVHMSLHQKNTLKLWLIPDASLGTFAEKLYWRFMDDKRAIGMRVDESLRSIVLFSDDKSIQKEIKSQEFQVSLLSSKEMDRSQGTILTFNHHTI